MAMHVSSTARPPFRLQVLETLDLGAERLEHLPCMTWLDTQALGRGTKQTSTHVRRMLQVPHHVLVW